jgi:hypothetical protein
MTVRDLLTRAFRFVKILGADEPMGADDATDALVTLNEVIEQINIDKLLAYYKTDIVFSTVAEQVSYTVGPSTTTPNIIAPRPVEIIDGFSRRDSNDYPLFIASKEDYNLVQRKGLTISGWQQAVYYEAAWPKGTLYVYPKPNDADTAIHLTVMAEIASYSTLNETVSLPPGYAFFLRTRIGERLAVDYGVPFTAQMEKLMTGAETAVKRNNVKPMPVARTGLAQLSSHARYDVMSDTSRS